MSRTPPAPQVLADLHLMLAYSRDRAQCEYEEIVPVTSADVHRHLTKLSPDSKMVLPVELVYLPRDMDAALEDAAKELETHVHGRLSAPLRWAQSVESGVEIVRRSLALVDQRHSKKILPNESECDRISARREQDTYYGPLAAGIWDSDLFRLDALAHEHRFLPEDWKFFCGEYRRLVAQSNRDILASILLEKQEERDQYVMHNLAAHPETPNELSLLLGYVAETFTDCSTIVAAIRERRWWLQETLEKNGFVASQMIRNHFQYQGDFEDAYLMRRTR